MCLGFGVKVPLGVQGSGFTPPCTPRPQKTLRGGSLEKAPVLDPFSDDLARAKSAKELKEHLETRVL